MDWKTGGIVFDHLGFVCDQKSVCILVFVIQYVSVVRHLLRTMQDGLTQLKQSLWAWMGVDMSSIRYSDSVKHRARAICSIAVGGSVAVVVYQASS